MFQITKGDFADTRIIELIRTHVEAALAQSGPESSHALDLSGLQSPDVGFWAIWEGADLLGMGALKRLSPEHGPDHGEVKSMHTVRSARGRGVGGAMLRHIMAEARLLGLSRLSLETGSLEYFRAARELYLRHGFVECPPFADYVLDRNSIFMTLELRASPSA